MTMPHLMNCAHSETGWCLECVKKMHDEMELLQGMANELSELHESAGLLLRPAVVQFAEIMEHQLRNNDHKKLRPRPTYSECLSQIEHIIARLRQTIRSEQGVNQLFCPAGTIEGTTEKFILINCANAANWMMLLTGMDINEMPK